MAFEVKDNTGSMFKNDRKESANHPDGKGSCIIDGVEYWISSWNKKTQEGKDWRSLAFTRKEKPAPRQERKPPSHDGARSRELAPKQREEFDDDVPF
jgi:hypothetical protein